MNYLTKAHREMNRWMNLRPVLEEKRRREYPLTPTQNSIKFFEQEPEHLPAPKQPNATKGKKLTFKKRSKSIVSGRGKRLNTTQQIKEDPKKQQTVLFTQTMGESDFNSELNEIDQSKAECKELRQKFEELKRKYGKAQGLNLKLKKDISVMKNKIVEATEVM